MGDLSKDGGQEAEGNRESGFGTRLDLAAWVHSHTLVAWEELKGLKRLEEEGRYFGREMPTLFGYLPLRLDFSLSLSIQTLVSQSSDVPFQKCPLLGQPTLLSSASPSIYLPKVWFQPPLTFDNDFALL